MQLHCNNLPWPIDKRLIRIINDAVATVEAEDGVTITFRDPDFTPESGGFHPVEFALNREGELRYVTDFCFVGSPPFCDLCKNLDFDFSLQLFQHYGMEHPISAGREMFALWQSNFIAYHGINAYTVTVEPW